tara:strand:+ start:1079 stop:4765 length:3687 start_codon:yes stop_codon:yes gene_type:complete
MSLSKKYVYVHECSLAANTPDNFRKVLGRGWVPSKNSGLQYGYEVSPRPMDMKFGPIMSWAHDYFYATEMPAKTQIVSIRPNPQFFPAVESNTLDMGDQGTASSVSDPCCGWYAYLGAHFKNHFSTGNPLQILRTVLETRAEAFKTAVKKGAIQDLQDRYFPDNKACGTKVTTITGGDQPADTQEPPTISTDAGTATAVSATPNSFGTDKICLYRDLWFQTTTPFSETEEKYIEGKEKALVSDVTFNYNFFLQAYEQQLRGNALPEIRIPNIYLTLGRDGSVPYVVYLQNNVECRLKDFEKLILQKGYRNLLVPIKQQPFLQDKNMYATSFPMDAKISFGTDRSTFVADSLEDSKMESVMLRRASEGELLLNKSAETGLSPGTTDPSSTTKTIPYTESTLKNLALPEEKKLNFAYAKRYYSTTSSDRSVNSGPYERQLPTFDFYQWLMSLPDVPPSAVGLPQDHIFLGNQNDSTDMALRTGLYQQNLSFLANYFILSGKINEIAKTHLRTYQQMMRGDSPHSETILYRISKYPAAQLNQVGVNSMLEGLDPMERDAMLYGSEGNPGYLTNASEKLEFIFDRINTGGVSPVQNIWIPNSNTLDVVEYVDTQIKYNKGYVYTVTAYELSVGTEYFYSQFTDGTESKPEPQFCDDKYGIISLTGPYVEKDVVSLLQISLDPALPEAEKYSGVMNLIQTNLDASFTCEGTGIGLLVKENTSTQQAPFNEYLIYCYCSDDPLPEQLEGWTKLGTIRNAVGANDTPGSQPNTGTEDQACRIYAQLETNLKIQLELADPSDSLVAALQQLGITSLPSVESSFVKRSRFLSKSCPDDWTEGAVQTFTRTTTIAEAQAGALEAVYLGEQKLEAVCECPPPEPCSENFLVTTIPSLKVHEVPYMFWSGKVLDSHPVGPDVEINPYRSVNNELLFKIGAGTGNYYDKPIIIKKGDKKAFDEVRKAQKIKDDTVQFRSDDPVRTFEVFMLTERPMRYTDFAKGTLRKYSTKVPSRPGQFSDAVSFIEKLEPNKKYYYTFRSYDVHGHMSNPTSIYQVELVDSDGAIYPLISIYEPVEELPVDLNRSGQRLLQIRPEYLQSVVDEENSGLTDATSAGTPDGLPSTTDLKLGVRDETLWGKKFKLRLTSCETRRMLDINLNFKTEHIVATDDCPTPEINDYQSDPNQGLDVPDNIPLPGNENTTTTNGNGGSVTTQSSGQTSTPQSAAQAAQPQSAPAVNLY